MASDEAKPASPAAADPPADDAKDPEPETETKAEARPRPKETSRRRRRRRSSRRRSVAGGRRARQRRRRRPRPRRPRPESSARPGRGRRSRGTRSLLAASPLSRSLLLFSRDLERSSRTSPMVHFLKRNIFQFSGFVWTDNQEKQRNRIKDKLDKFNKEKLLDFCEILDIHVSKATTKKEEVSAKLLEFLESPCITRDVVLTDDKKKRRRRSKGNGQATSEGASSDKKRKRGQKEAAEDEKENDDEADAGSEDASMEEGDGGSEANDHAVSDEESDEPPAKKKSTEVKEEKKEAGSKAKEKDTPKKSSTKPSKGASKASEDIKDEPDVESKKVGKRAKSSKESDAAVDSNKGNKRVSKSKKDETQNSKAGTKDGAKLSNKNKGKGKGGADAGSAPTTEQLQAVVTTILKEVDFNTATLADILRQLGTHFKMDLMDRKAEVKRIIEEVINSMSDDEDGDDDNSEDEAEGNGKAENSKDDPKEGEENSTSQFSLSPESIPDPTPAMVQEMDAAAELRIRQQGEPSLVQPAEETPNGLYYLSNLDQNIAVIVQTVYCFRAVGNDRACDVLRESLAKVLVPYYPLAGRLTISGDGKLVVDCTGDGAVFVEAEADCAMADIGDVTEPDPSVLGRLVYSVPGAKNILEMPLLAAQVTKFKCGGFVLGLAINHCMFDGVGAMQFVNSWGETARGLPLSLPPVLDRAVLRARDPPQVAFPHHEFAQITDDEDGYDEGSVEQHGGEPLLHRSFRFTPASIARIKALAAAQEQELDGGRACTTFEALAGFVWSARTRALGMSPSRRSKLLFAVDGRPRFSSPPLPPGYFGNAIVLTSASCAAGELTLTQQASPALPRAVRLVRGAVEAVTDAYMRSAVDYFEATRARPSLASTLLITAWSRLPFRAADFGWGPPAAYGPAALPEKEVALFLSCGEEGGGVRVLLGLPAPAMAEFARLVDEVTAS
ncbi:hypothetical protein EJB05_16415 [Eragrostis curvula]|uniref:DEK-C domain-containing protein n=1 Tax=Eragrostis curvula TaxID=38414 RepID=A0A5J9VFW3_9POAL|nr:hypothetical protein EJB05_16415 [Eragrostis curvula]